MCHFSFRKDSVWVGEAGPLKAKWSVLLAYIQGFLRLLSHAHTSFGSENNWKVNCSVCVQNTGGTSCIWDGWSSDNHRNNLASQGCKQEHGCHLNCLVWAILKQH